MRFIASPLLRQRIESFQGVLRRGEEGVPGPSSECQFRPERIAAMLSIAQAISNLSFRTERDQMSHQDKPIPHTKDDDRVGRKLQD